MDGIRPPGLSQVTRFMFRTSSLAVRSTFRTSPLATRSTFRSDSHAIRTLAHTLVLSVSPIAPTSEEPS